MSETKQSHEQMMSPEEAREVLESLRDEGVWIKRSSGEWYKGWFDRGETGEEGMVNVMFVDRKPPFNDMAKKVSLHELVQWREEVREHLMSDEDRKGLDMQLQEQIRETGGLWIKRSSGEFVKGRPDCDIDDRVSGYIDELGMVTAIFNEHMEHGEYSNQSKRVPARELIEWQSEHRP